MISSPERKPKLEVSSSAKKNYTIAWKTFILMIILLPYFLAACKDENSANNPSGDAPLPEPAVLSGMNLTFRDEFDGTSLDTTRWEAPDNIPRQGGSMWKSDQVSVSCGLLRLGIVLTNRKDNRYDCGAVRTKRDYWEDLFVQTYGYFEIRARLPQDIDNDYWAAFWMMAGEVSDNQPFTQNGHEIDIMESFFFANNGEHKLTMHWNGYGTKHNTWSLDCGFHPQVLDNEFHTYGFYWDQNKYISYLDGMEVGRTDFIGKGSLEDGKTLSNGPCKKPGYIKLTCEAAEWAGGPYNTYPTHDAFLVDYVRVWEGTIP